MYYICIKGFWCGAIKFRCGKWTNIPSHTNRNCYKCAKYTSSSNYIISSYNEIASLFSFARYQFSINKMYTGGNETASTFVLTRKCHIRDWEEYAKDGRRNRRQMGIFNIKYLLISSDREACRPIYRFYWNWFNNIMAYKVVNSLINPRLCKFSVDLAKVQNILEYLLIKVLVIYVCLNLNSYVIFFCQTHYEWMMGSTK